MYMSVDINLARFLKIIEKKFKSVYVHYNVGHKFHFSRLQIIDT